MKKKITAVLIAILMLIYTAVPVLGATVKNGGTKYIAHRGYSGIAPENTLAAIRLAGENGYDACEFDIWQTKDGEWVVLHDDTVDRTTDGTGAVKELTLSQIKQLKIDAGNGLAEYPNEIIPTLEEALAVCSETGITPVIEIKDGNPDGLRVLYERLDKSGFVDKTTVVSFNRDCLTVMRSLSKTLDLRLLVFKSKAEDIDFCKKNEIQGISVDFTKTTPYDCKKLRESGLILTAWTVDDKRDGDNLVDQGFEYITTNKLLPGELKESGTPGFGADVKTMILRLPDYIRYTFKNTVSMMKQLFRSVC